MCAANAVVDGPEHARKLVKAKSSGRIDGMVHSAYYHPDWSNLDAHSIDQLSTALDVIAVGGLRMAQAVIPTMKAQGSGSIVNVSTLATRKPMPGEGGYAMAKAALNMMTLTSARDYIKSGIHMNAVDTGWVTDEDPAEIAARKVAEQAEFATGAAGEPCGDGKGTVTELGGRVQKSEYWGLRNLAYRIRKNRKAHYILMDIDAPAAAIQEVERQQRFTATRAIGVERPRRLERIDRIAAGEDIAPILIAIPPSTKTLVLINTATVYGHSARLYVIVEADQWRPEFAVIASTLAASTPRTNSL